MQEIEFTIKGNGGVNTTGNPLPKVKLTGRQQWTKRAQRYKQWKDHVQNAFLSSISATDSDLHRKCVSNIMLHGKPLQTGSERCRMDIVIDWADKRHGDPENIFGSIADALFVQDKYLAGSFDYRYNVDGSPQVNVEVVALLQNNS